MTECLVKAWLRSVFACEFRSPFLVDQMLCLPDLLCQAVFQRVELIAKIKKLFFQQVRFTWNQLNRVCRYVAFISGDDGLHLTGNKEAVIYRPLGTDTTLMVKGDAGIIHQGYRNVVGNFGGCAHRKKGRGGIEWLFRQCIEFIHLLLDFSPKWVHDCRYLQHSLKSSKACLTSPFVFVCLLGLSHLPDRNPCRKDRERSGDKRLPCLHDIVEAAFQGDEPWCPHRRCNERENDGECQPRLIAEKLHSHEATAPLRARQCLSVEAAA